MQPLHFDQINPVTGTLFWFDDPNLKFIDGIGMFLENGDEGYVPYPNEVPVPEKKKKPFRRRAKSTAAVNPEPIATNIMSTFKYNTRQNSQGGFTTSVELGEPIAEAAFLGLVSATAGTTPEIAEAVLRATVAHMCGCCAGSSNGRNLLDSFSFQPTSGGSGASPDGFHNADDINAGISISLTRETIVAWQSTLTLQHMGELGKVAPNIDSIINSQTGALNIYIAANLMQVRDDHLKFNRNDLLQGLFLTDAAGVETRCTVYADIEPLSFTFLVPAGTTGPQTVRMCAHINGSLRSFTYGALITTV